MKDKSEIVEEKFILAIIKQIDVKNKTTLVTVKSESMDFPLEEVVFYIEGWLEKSKEELKRLHFGNMQFRTGRTDDKS